MSAATNHTESLALTWLMTTSSATRPTAWYVGLFTAAPTDAGTGSGTEVSTSGTAYARKQVTFSVNTTGTSPNITTRAQNTATLLWDPATANWGTVTHLAVFDASTGGNMLFYGALTANKTIDSGDAFQILANNLSIELQ